MEGRNRAIAAAVLTLLGLIALPHGAEAAWQPAQPITFVVPAGKGGGADQMAHEIAEVVAKHNLAGQPINVINEGSGAGSQGFLDVKGAAGDPDKIIITLSNLFTT